MHALIDTLPDGELPVALRFLESLDKEGAPAGGPWSLENAPLDDEPLTPEEEEALAEAERDLAAGLVVSHSEARRRLLGES
ncbi:MAG TPA: hypothetical protein VE685_14510 [Thermoanaerobaculia bacterium]|nr:hypothetical protein [Thermoanaerobaculia bacterium]